jgi:hypothetical protein
MSMATMRLASTDTILTTLRLLLEASIRASLNITLAIPVKGRVKDMLLLEASIRVPPNITLAIPVKGRVKDMLLLEASIRVLLNITLAIPVKGKVKDMPVFVLIIPSERQPLPPTSHFPLPDRKSNP